jgi:hypothetical protein
MKHTSTRSLIAGLGFTLVAASALAQTGGAQSAPTTTTQPPSAVQTTPAAPMPGMSPGSGMAPNSRPPRAVVILITPVFATLTE